MEHAPVDLYTLLCLAAENLQELLSQKEVQVEIPDRGSAEMYGDMEWSMEAVMNHDEKLHGTYTGRRENLL